MSGFVAKLVGAVIAILTGFGLLHASQTTVSGQLGYSGTGMQIVKTKDQLAEIEAANVLPPAIPAADPNGPRAGQVFQNVQVLGGLSAGEFTRLMAAMTTWVSPQQGCVYCHNPANMASDELYTKVVSRRMIQMVQHINSDWKAHVKATGVTCYTCHQGQPVPRGIWFSGVEHPQEARAVGGTAGQNQPSYLAGLTSLPMDPLTPFLSEENDIRVLSTHALPGTNHASIKQAEWTYGLMMYMSDSLGVNCTFCHNTRSMAAWEASPVTRATAWYGIRLARDLNGAFLTPLKSVLPATRLGPTGDAPKVGCATCHNGVHKPLLGVSMLKDYQRELGGPTPYVPTVPTATTTTSSVTTTSTLTP
jgi:photosynthetic reaction center cytochrome c subunit